MLAVTLTYGTVVGIMGLIALRLSGFAILVLHHRVALDHQKITPQDKVSAIMAFHYSFKKYFPDSVWLKAHA